MSAILVIEDDKLIRANLERWLKLEGYAVSVAENGELGVELALKQAPAAVICDLVMPGIDGYTVLNRLRANAATARIPFILLTASADKAERQRGIAQGVTCFLAKPFDLRELGAALKDALSASAPGASS